MFIQEILSFKINPSEVLDEGGKPPKVSKKWMKNVIRERVFYFSNLADKNRDCSFTVG